MVTGWQADAACLGRTDLDWFVEPPLDECVALCAGCPVASDCLVYGLGQDVSWDVGCLAGTGPEERQAIRRNMPCQKRLL